MTIRALFSTLIICTLGISTPTNIKAQEDGFDDGFDSGFTSIESVRPENLDDVGLTPDDLDQMKTLPGGLGLLPPLKIPADNPQTEAKIRLGHMLYFDKRLSKDFSMSCATCHNPEKGWSDGLPRTIGFGGKELGRHSPTIINSAHNSYQFWDGRSATLEDQATGPIMAAGEMNCPTEDVLIQRLLEAQEYKGAFEANFNSSPTLKNVGKAIAAFEKTIVTGDSPFDKYVKGDKSALSQSEKRGLILFIGKASCVACHNGPNFTDDKFHNLGVEQAGPLSEDLGRFAVTKDEKDRGAFKTPGLRNITQSSPYMHTGVHKTLEETVEFYNQGGGDDKNKSKLMMKLDLTSDQKQDLVAFLKALTGPLPDVKPPVGKPFGI